ncbi:MAG: response regulator transcription factor [Anaerolineae bacterium]|nr:response regulator transcription factor [Anaerolineae bacterium]
MFKVVIVDDYQMIRSGLSLLFSVYDDMQVVATGADGYEAIALCRSHRPDILVIDYQMPLLNGISAIHEIRREFPTLLIILISSLADAIQPDTVSSSGVNLHLLKDSNTSDIISTIRQYAVSHVLGG